MKESITHPCSPNCFPSVFNKTPSPLHASQTPLTQRPDTISPLIASLTASFWFSQNPSQQLLLKISCTPSLRITLNPNLRKRRHVDNYETRWTKAFKLTKRYCCLKDFYAIHNLAIIGDCHFNGCHASTAIVCSVLCSSRS